MGVQRGHAFSSLAGGNEEEGNQSLSSSSSLWTMSLTRTASSIREATSLFAWMTVPWLSLIHIVHGLPENAVVKKEQVRTCFQGRMNGLF